MTEERSKCAACKGWGFDASQKSGVCELCGGNGWEPQPSDEEQLLNSIQVILDKANGDPQQVLAIIQDSSILSELANQQRLRFREILRSAPPPPDQSILPQEDWNLLYESWWQEYASEFFLAELAEEVTNSHLDQLEKNKTT